MRILGKIIHLSSTDDLDICLLMVTRTSILIFHLNQQEH